MKNKTLTVAVSILSIWFFSANVHATSGSNIESANTSLSRSIENFNSLIEIFKVGGTCGDCQFWISGTEITGVIDLNIMTSTDRLPKGMRLSSPKNTSGVSRVFFDTKMNQYIYSESDVAGWTNVAVSVLNNKILSIDFYKTLPGLDKNGTPNGQRYNEGVKCGRALYKLK